MSALHAATGGGARMARHRAVTALEGPQPSKTSPSTPETFGALLRAFRLRVGLSQNALAKYAGIDASYLWRLEDAGERRHPGPDVVQACGRALRLSPGDYARLLHAAGYATAATPAWASRDPVLVAVASVIADERLSAADVAEFRRVVTSIAARWRGRE